MDARSKSCRLLNNVHLQYAFNMKIPLTQQATTGIRGIRHSHYALRKVVRQVRGAPTKLKTIHGKINKIYSNTSTRITILEMLSTLPLPMLRYGRKPGSSRPEKSCDKYHSLRVTSPDFKLTTFASTGKPRPEQFIDESSSAGK